MIQCKKMKVNQEEKVVPKVGKSQQQKLTKKKFLVHMREQNKKKMFLHEIQSKGHVMQWKETTVNQQDRDVPNV